MAKVIIEFDTLEKTLSTSVDGQALSDVESVHIEPDYEHWRPNVPSRVFALHIFSVGQESDGMREFRRLTASDQSVLEKEVREYLAR